VNRLRAAIAALSLLIAGLCSASLSHGIVWLLTALGVIAGPYTAYAHGATATVVLATAIIGGSSGIVALACASESARRGGDPWFAATQHTIARIGPLRAFLAIGVVQLSAILALEYVEQVIQFGQSLGPLAALGAPLLVGLPIHLLCAIGIVSLLFWVARAAMRTESDLRRRSIEHIRRRPRSASLMDVLRLIDPSNGLARLTPLSRRFANRPPPAIAA
jgi:hypothetical protein